MASWTDDETVLRQKSQDELIAMCQAMFREGKKQQDELETIRASYNAHMEGMADQATKAVRYGIRVLL
jgi:hypothetical protein